MAMEMELVATILLAFVLAAVTAANDTTVCADSGGFSLRLVGKSHGPAATVNITAGHLRPRLLGPLDVTYSVVVGASGHDYHLALHATTSLTWMRCKPCAPELRQHGPIFDAAASKSYHLVPATSPMCGAPNPVHPADGKCSFHVPLAHGYLGLDTFTLGSEAVPGVVFGCAHSTERFHGHGDFAGMLGVGKLPTSLILQLADRARWRFSYCLIGHRWRNHHGFLRFGGDIPHREGLHITSILPAFHPHESSYYVSLAGVSVNGERLRGVDAGTFKRHSNGQGGSLVDPGAKITFMVAPTYEAVEKHVMSLLHRHGGRRVKQPGYGLCVGDTPEIRPHLPSLTLHFAAEEEEAKLHVRWQQVFAVMDEESICLAVKPDAHVTVIGAMQQVDTRFVFDLGVGKIFFAPEQCHLDTGHV